MPIKVFIVGPYNDSAEHLVRERRTHEMLDVFHELLECGFAPYCPLWTHYAHEYAPQPRDAWLALASAWLETCDCVYMMPQCRERPESAAWAEAEHARMMGKPVFDDIYLLKRAFFTKE